MYFNNKITKLESSVWIIVDNLIVGGIERLALDQMYQLSDDRVSSRLIVLDESATFNTSNFWENERNLIVEKNLKIDFFPSKRLEMIKILIRNLLSERPRLIVDYTIKMSPLLRALLFLLRMKVPVHCVVQQLASLSAPRQRYKRMLYAQFSTRLFINSVYYSKDWEFHVSRNVFTKTVFRKRHRILRNGVYLHRLRKPNGMQQWSTNQETTQRIRFIFLGRLKAWKGLDRLQLLDKVTSGNCDFLVIVPYRDDNSERSLSGNIQNRVSFVLGKSLLNFEPQKRDVHVYGVNYGEKVKFPESVSTNCLEMALLGIPSLVTFGGAENWPELNDLKLIYEVNWCDENDIHEKVIQIFDDSKDRRISQNFKQVVSVKRNLDEHFSFVF